MTQKLTITHELDEYFKKLAASLPPMQMAVNGVPQKVKGEKLFVNYHAEILVRYAKGGRKEVKRYVKEVMKSYKKQLKK